MLPVQPTPLSPPGDQEHGRGGSGCSGSSSGDGSGSGHGSGSGRTGAGARPSRSSPCTRDSLDSSSSARGGGTPRAYYECQPRHYRRSNSSNSSAVGVSASTLHSPPPSAATAQEILLTVSCKGVALAIQLPPPSPPLPLTQQQQQQTTTTTNNNGNIISSDGSDHHDAQRPVGPSPVPYSPFLALALASLPVPPPLVVDHLYTESTPAQGGNVLARVMLHLDWDDITAWGYNPTSLRVQYIRRRTGGRVPREEQQGMINTPFGTPY